MSKYKLKTFALLLAMPVIFTACTLQDLPVIGALFGNLPTGPIELTMWGLWEKDFVFQPVLEEYQKSKPNTTLKYEDMSVLNLKHLVEYKIRAFNRMEQNNWGTDIVMVHNSWMPRLIASDLLEPMASSLMTAEEYSQLFYPVATSSAVSGGKVYAIPAFYDGLVLVYNKKHFEVIGQTTPPIAWEEFRRTAIDLTILADSKGRDFELLRGGAAIGAADNIDHFSDILGLLWQQAGISIPEQLDSEPAQDALSFYVSLMKDHLVWKETFPEASTAFVNEQVSMILVPSWQVLDILTAAPNLSIGVAPVPQALPNNPVSWGSFWMYAVPKNSDDKAEAWNFLNFLATEDSEILIFDEAEKTRAFGAAYGLTSLATEIDSHPYLGALIRTAPFAQSSEVAARSGNRAQEEALKEAVNAVLSGELTVEEALVAAKEKINP